MLLIAIATAEILFWVLLVAGLLVRYALKAPRIGAGLLLATPVVDLALLILTYIDLSTGTIIELPTWSFCHLHWLLNRVGADDHQISR